MTTDYKYCFFVKYIENGELCADTWSEKTLELELNRNDVKIVSVSLAYDIQVALGLIED